jgi:hypothetical protein
MNNFCKLDATIIGILRIIDKSLQRIGAKKNKALKRSKKHHAESNEIIYNCNYSLFVLTELKTTISETLKQIRL